jgi:trehalose-phosphatase
VRPTFRTADWEHYVAVNRKFAEAVFAEAKKPEPDRAGAGLPPGPAAAHDPRAPARGDRHHLLAHPLAQSGSVLHLSLARGDSRGPARQQHLGFHTQFHCNNFVDTVDRMLEARVDRESFTVSYGGKPTVVKRYPISIDWPPAAELTARRVEDCRAEVRAPARPRRRPSARRRRRPARLHQGRHRALPRHRAPARTGAGLDRPLQLRADRRADAHQHRRIPAVRGARARPGEEINARFGRGGYQPIILKIEHHEPPDVYEYYRAADLCFVSSLHDGMNLVAKEFVAARDDDRGVLILSQFTGAARELPEALIVNPYDADQCAAALHMALAMPAGEQRDRMRLMRGLVAEFNVYRWAGRMLLDAAGMRRRGKVQERRSHGRAGNDGCRRIPQSDAGRAFFLDIDGTLLEIADRPSGVRVDAALIDMIRRLHACSGGAVALISGRRVADIDALFPGLRLPLAGQHGLERRDAAGGHPQPCARRRGLALAEGAGQGTFETRKGILVEDKGLTLAVHFRLNPAEEGRRRGAARHRRDAGAAVSLQPGKCVLEIKPAGRDKGTAIAEFMAEPPFEGRRPVFIGDDVTDEYGFRMVNDMGG